MEIMCIDSLLGLYGRDTSTRGMKALKFYQSLTPDQKEKCKWDVTLTPQETTGRHGRVIGNDVLNGVPKADHRSVYQPATPSNIVKQLSDRKSPTMLPCSNCRGLFSLERELKRCAGCQKEHYCGFDCQRNHWKVHKKVCQSPTLERKRVEKAKQAA
eukprot:comp22999_c0_seq1/m.36633 comp22999_c0_seq1/g.36633  ORF comp22999_c0_seq1/g.36633 comp22999_c0_seq1/m.36633 type:complete len:157 (-) comp22999_c0_seq1:568-1038(-)